MRFILIYKFGMSQKKTERVDLDNCQNTTNLLEFLQKKISKAIYQFVVRIRKDKMLLKIIKGWPLQQYQIKQGAQLQIQIPDRQEQELQKNSKNKYLFNILKNNTVLPKINQIPQEKQSFASQKSTEKNQGNIIRKYLDKQLEKLLKQVQKGTVQNLIDFLQQVPDKLDQQSILQIQTKKPHLIHQLGQGGWGAIHYAIYWNKLDIIQFLIKRDINLNKCTNDGWLPLQLAVNRKNHSLVQFLISQKPLININQTTTRGSALHCAMRINDAQSVKILLQAGIDWKLLDQKFKTALQVTSDYDCQLLVKQHEERVIIQQQQKKQKQQKQQRQTKLNLSHALLKGHVYKVRALFNQSLRFLVLDPLQGTLILYQQEEHYPKKPKQVIPIASIKKVRIIKQQQKSWPLKKQFTYFEVYSPSRMIMGCKNHQIVKRWVHGIYDSILLIVQIQNDKDLKQKLQKQVFFLNDKKNQIIQQKKKQVKKPAIQRKITINILNKSQKQIQTTKSTDDTVKPPSVNSSQVNSTQNKSFQGDKNQGQQKQDIEKPIQDAKQLNDSLNNLTNDDKITFSSFQIIKTLGSGSFGKVFLVRHISTNKLYALKALKKKTLIVKKQLKYAIAQANVLKKANHPFIINLHYAFQTPNYLYLALDYCSGKDLSFHLAREVLFSQQQAKFYIAQLLLAIEHLHQKNIIYRDLKPQNILLDHEGHIKLADFGLSKDNVEDKTKSFCGSPAYLSPQMLAQKGVGKQSDIYGLGCVLYQFLVGEPPYYSDDIPQLYKNIKQAKLKFPKGISQEAKSLISGLLERDPRKRLGTKNKNDIKNHPFFGDINWDEIASLKIPPPARNVDQDDEEQNSDDQIELLNKGKTNFTDYDYDDSTKKINRLINFSFIRTQE